MKLSLYSKLLSVIVISILFSFTLKNSGNIKNNSNSVSRTSIFLSEPIKFSEYTISKSYLDALNKKFKIVIFQVEIDDGEFKLIAYYSKPGRRRQKKVFIRIPESELVKGKAITLNFPFSIGNNQILRRDIMGIPPHRYDNLQIIPFIENQILKFELKGLTSALAPIPLGNTNPSPPDTSFE